MNLSARKLIKKGLDKGFTLIELLVVIGVLGILAAALVTTIDPIEQLNRARDANIKNVSVEFQNAVIRYFTNHNAPPWETAANGGIDACNTAAGSEDPSGVALSSLTACVNQLITEGELKTGFSDFSDLDRIFITEPSPQSGNENDTAVCYSPVSAGQQRDPNTKFTQTGADGVDCKSTGGSTNCYWCTQ